VRIEYVLDAWPTPRRATGEVLVSRRRPGRRRRPSGAPDYISEGDMKHVLAIVLVLHGLIHTLGFVKAFRLADVAQLREPIGPAAGLLWLTAAALLVASAALLLAGARAWWMPALAGVVLSQALIVSAWSDAKYGTLANGIALAALLVVLLDFRTGRLRSSYDQEGRQGPAQAGATPVLTEAEMAALALPVRMQLERGRVDKVELVSSPSADPYLLVGRRP
jgi:hypothetical protein